MPTDRRVRPFRVQATLPCPPLDDLLLALAAEFRPVDVRAVRAALDDLARGAMHAAGAPAPAQAAALREVLAPLKAARAGAGARAFALDAVLSTRSGHPVVLTVLAHEVARRAGLPFGVGGQGARHLLVHRRWPAPVVVEPGVADPEELPEGLRWRCSHQVAFAALTALGADLLLAGDLAGAERALDLRLVLPMEEHARVPLERELRAVRARLN